MIRFEHPYYLWILVAILPCLFVWHLYVKGDIQWSSYYQVEKATRRLTVRFVLWTLAMVCLVLALVNPQYGYTDTKVEKKSSDIYIALDISSSMDCEDLKPSRLERAKKIGEDLIKGLRTERIGLILFAAEAYMQMPLTHDYRTALLFLKNASSQQAGTQGTSFAEVIDLASRSTGDDDLRSRILIILSDGEAHDDEVSSHAQSAYEEGVYQFAVGIGTTEGGLIPIAKGQQSDYLRDDAGTPVRTKLSEGILRDVANAGGGAYFHHSETSRLLKEVMDKVARLERKAYDTVSFTARASYYRWMLVLALSFGLTALFYQRGMMKK